MVAHEKASVDMRTNTKHRKQQTMASKQAAMIHGKGKGSIYEVTQKMEKSNTRGRRSKKNKEEIFMEKEFKINDRFAKNNSHVIYFNDVCYKVTGTATFKDGYSWRCGHAKYHISKDEKDPNTGEHYVFMLVADKPVKIEGTTVEWPVFDHDIYEAIMRGRERISRQTWKHKVLTDELTLQMKDDLHHIRLGNTRKRKSDAFDENELEDDDEDESDASDNEGRSGGMYAAKRARHT
jgi:hypothetical protein